MRRPDTVLAWIPHRISLSTVAGSLLCLWVLASNVHSEYHPVRAKPPLPARTSSGDVTIPLVAAERFRDPYVVVICRVRNTGSAPVTVSARTGTASLEQTVIPPRVVRRIDLAFERPALGAPAPIHLAGSGPTWELEYLEIANLHGFNRGAIEFLILPGSQPFPSAPASLWVAAAGCVLLLLGAVPIPMPSWARGLHFCSAALAIGLFAAAAISPVVSQFRVVLSPHTYALGLVLLVGRCAVSLLVRAGRRLPRARCLVAVARAVPRLPWFEVASALLLAVFAGLVWAHVGAYGGGSDSSGYLNVARLLARGAATTPVRPVSSVPHDGLPTLAYSPSGFRPAGVQTLAPTYPVGLPMMIVALSWIRGIDAAAHQVMWLTALAGVVLVYVLARVCGLSRWAGLLAASILAASPLYLFVSLILMSDVPSLAWVTAAVLLAWRSRGRPIWAPAAGLALSVAVLTRPTNVLAIAPVAVCLGLSLRHWILLGLGGLPAMAVLFSFNLAAYGTAFTTGYPDAGTPFAADNVWPSLRHYAKWLPVVLTPISVLILGIPLLRRSAPRITLLLMSWIAPFFIVYAFYSHTHDAWWYLRFLMPALPPMIVGSLLVARMIVARAGAGWLPPRRAAGAIGGGLVAVLLLAHNLLWVRHLDVLSIGRGDEAYLASARWARSHVPPGAVIVSMQVSGALFCYTDFPLLRYDHLNRAQVRRVLAATSSRRQPLYAILFPFELEERRLFDSSAPGTWVQVGAVRQITMWKYLGPPGPSRHLATTLRPDRSTNHGRR